MYLVTNSRLKKLCKEILQTKVDMLNLLSTLLELTKIWIFKRTSDRNCVPLKVYTLNLSMFCFLTSVQKMNRMPLFRQQINLF